MQRTKALALSIALCAGLGGSVWLFRGLQQRDAPRDPTLEEEVQAFQELERASPVARGAVLFTGSSSIRRWESLAEDLHPLRVVNRGFGGSQLADLVRFHAALLGDLAPSAVVVYAGDNDLDASTGKTAANVVADYRELVELLWASHPELPIFYLAIKPSIQRRSRWEEMREANERIAAWSASDARLTFVDVASPLLSASGEPRAELFLADGMHLNPDGYSAWADVLLPVLLDALPPAASKAPESAQNAE